MARRTTEVLTEREAEIMEILWEFGEATSEQIRSQLDGEPHDSSVRTFLRVLDSKGYVRTNRRRKPIVYRPIVPKERVQKKAATALLQRFFGGSAEALVLRLIEDEKLTPEQLSQLKKKSSTRKRGSS